MLKYLLIGIGFGLSAGVSPGPLMVLVISETIRHNTMSGIKVAIAPLITDAPIIIISFLLVSQLSRFDVLLGILSVAGSVYIVTIAIENWKATPVVLGHEIPKPRSFSKGIITNALSPHPYLFWFTVGAPIMLAALQVNGLALAGYVLGFYCCLIGAKVLIAVIIGRSRSFLSDRTFVLLNKCMSVVLLLFSVLLFRDGVRFIFTDLF